MWIPKSALEKRLMAAVENGQPIERRDYPENDLLAEGDALACSPLFGEFLELLLPRWNDLDDPTAATRTVCFGLKKNAFRDAVIHAIDALVDAELDDLAPFSKALDTRASDDDSPLAIRMEAVAGLTRFALQSPRFTSFASSGVLRLLDVEDDWVKAKLCRLVSILHDQLAWADAVDSLKHLTQCQACSVEAHQELGFVEMANAFRSEDIATMSAHFAQSAAWFDESNRISENAPRARMYGAVAHALARSLSSQGAEGLDLQSLNDDAQWVVHYNPPRAGAQWLSAPPEAELEWLPLLVEPRAPAGMARFELLAGAVQLFEKVRSVGVRAKGVLQYRPPQGFSQLTEQGRLVGTLRQWLSGGAAEVLSADGRAQLTSNLAQLGEPPGKH